MKLSVAMIVKNEEKYIEGALKPLKEIQKYIESEIIVVDTGSKDNTVEIARKYTDKVYFHQWNNNFADMRNISINYCTGEWILVVDADEVLYDVEGIVTLLKSKALNGYNGAFIKIINFHKDIKNSINNGHISPLLRLFRKNTIKYEGIVHEQPRYQKPLKDTNIRFVHYGYNNNDYELIEYKFKRNLGLLLQELKNKPDDVYINYQVSASYHIHGDLKEALKYIEIAYDKGKKDIGNYIYVIDKYCSILNSMKNYELLVDKVREGIKYCNNFIDFYFYLGEAYYNLNQYDSAIDAYEKYLLYYDKLQQNDIVLNNTISVVTRVYKDNVLYNLSLCYYKNSCHKEALDTIEKIDNEDLLKERVYIILKIIVEGKLWNKVYILKDLIDKYNYENTLLYIDKELLMEDLAILNKNKLEGNLKEIVSITKCCKDNSELSEKVIDRIKEIIDQNKMLYSVYLYYVLKHNISEIKQFMIYGKDKIENVLVALCCNYLDFNGVLIEGLKKIEPNTFKDMVMRTIMKRALLLGGKLPSERKKDLFLSYISEKYYCIVKSYNKQLMEEDNWMLSSEDRFIIELKNALEYKYEDTLEYIRSIKVILNLEKAYVDYIKLLIEDEIKTVNNEIKAFIPELVKNIEGLINSEKYQEAYNTIEEGLALVKFDFNLMVLKYQLLIQFNYMEEARECLRDAILYGSKEEVGNFINNIGLKTIK